MTISVGTEQANTSSSTIEPSTARQDARATRPVPRSTHRAIPLDASAPSHGTPAGGFSVWVTLPRDVDAAELFRLAIDRGVSFVPGAVFFPGDLQHNTLRPCVSALAPAAIARGVRLLGEAVTELLGRRTCHLPFTP